MMTNYLALSARISKELHELEQVVERCLDIWQQFETSTDDRYLDGVALNLHSFYSGLERILEMTLAQVDQSLPTGPHWHQELLRQAATPIPGLRPALLSDDTRDALDRYRGFRHVVRNIYSFEMDEEEIAPLIREMRIVFASVRSDLMRFAEVLMQIGQDNTE